MAFCAQSSSGGGAQLGYSSSGATAARPLSYVLGSFGPLLDHASLVRLRVDVPSTVAALAAAAADEGGDDEETAAQVAQAAVCAVGQLNEVIRGIEDKAEDAKVAAVLEVMQDKTLQLLCSKAVVAKVYKSLLPHQEALGFSMAPAKACLSQRPVAGWDLQESLQTAVIKTLTGSSTGTASCSSSSGPSTAHAGTQGQLQGQQGWMCLSRHKLVGSNLLVAVPGQVSTALFVELEVVFDAGNKGMLLIVHAAGSLKFRPFSPCQVLQQDAKSLKAPLTLDGSDSDLLSDPSKLAAAARQLDGRPVKLLPDDRLVFIKSLTAAPTDPAQLQRMSQFWLGCYGLLLPPSFPFLVGVATHPEAEAAQMQVPSCCVLTNLGLSTLPGSQPGGSCHTAAVSRLAADLQAAAAGYSFWGHKLTVQLKGGGGAGVGLSQAKMQLTQATSQPAAGEVAGASAVQLQAYSLLNQWKLATELSKLQAQAGKQPQQKEQQHGTAAAEMQLMGLVEADPWAVAGGGPGRLVDSSRQEGLRGEHRCASSSADKSRWEGLKAYLAEKESQQKTQLQLSAGPGIAAPAAAGSLFTPARTLVTTKAAGSTAAPARSAAAAAVAGGGPAAPRFGSRKPGISKPPSAATAPAAKAPKAKKPAGDVSKLLAGLQAAHVEAAGAAPAAAAAAVAGQDAAAGGSLVTQPTAAEAAARPSAPVIAPKAPALGKRPGTADAATAAKPPAAKKAKTAAGAGPGTAAAAATKPKAPKKPKAAAAGPAGAAAPAEAAAGADAATAGAAPAGAAVEQGAGLQPAAADQQQQRKRTKASDLDLSAVTAKIQAAFAASAGAALKGVSVPEMQCYLRAQGVKGGSAKRADVEARLLQLMAGQPQAGAS